MSVYVCDAICGSGKSTAAINMVNSKPDKKYMFVTQYLTEVDRVCSMCTGFKSPSTDSGTSTSKKSDLIRLVYDGSNIATTHSLFLRLDQQSKDKILNAGYTLILDEVVDTVENSDLEDADVELLYSENNASVYRSIANKTEYMNLEKSPYGDWLWVLPKDILNSFEDVYILTYLFHTSSLKCYLDSNNIEYHTIGVKHSDEDGYVFCSTEEQQRAVDYTNLIHIIEDDKYNEIGNKLTDLSYNWYRKEAKAGGVDIVRKNIRNVFDTMLKAKKSQAMWTTYKIAANKILSSGIKYRCFVPYNKRASNDYRDRIYLAYCVNNFPRPPEFEYFKANGATMDRDGYALSILIQWMFRSAIRDGKEIWIYIPSKRMRNLLKIWIKKLKSGKDLEPIAYEEVKEKKHNDQKLRITKHTNRQLVERRKKK